MATTSKAANALFALPEAYDSMGAGARRAARHARKQQLTESQGSAAANTQLANEAAAQADAATAAVTPKVEQMATEHELLGTTIGQMTNPNTNPNPPLALNGPTPNPAATPRAQALGEARAAEYYDDTARSLDKSARWWGPLIVIVLGLAALAWQWYNRQAKLPIVVVTAALALAAFYPVYVMQIPRAAISPLAKLVPAP